MGNVYAFWESWIIPKAVGFYNNIYLTAIRQSFYILIPFWLIISILDVIGNVFLNPQGILLSNQGLNLGFWLTGGLSGEEYLQSDLMQTLKIYHQVVDAGYGIITIIITLTLSGRLSEIWQSDKYLTMFCALSSFIFMSPLPDVNQVSFTDYFSQRGFFTAFTVTFASSWLFAHLSKWKRIILNVPVSMADKLPYYISVFLPVLFTLLTFMLLSILTLILKPDFDVIIKSLSDSLLFQEPFFVLVYQSIVWLLWWFGIPGYGVTSSIQEIAYIPAQFTNQFGDTNYVFTAGFFEAGVIHVLGLMISILVFSQHELWRSISKFSIPIMMFNIQEVFLFGLPVVLNPIFLLPYILAPLANTLVGYVAIYWGIVPIFQIDLPWTMPLFLSAAIGTHSIMGCILQIVWLIMDIFIYAPFVITANSIEVDN